MLSLLVFKEIVIILWQLAFLVLGVLLAINAVKEFKKEKITARSIANELLEDLGKVDKPLMLNVSQERLIEKVADEMERRSFERGKRFYDSRQND